MSSTGSPAGAMAGFTLLELLVVIVIMALGMALVPGMLAPGTEAQSLKIDLRQVVSGLRFARTRAIVLNTPVAMSIDVQSRQIGIGSRGPVTERIQTAFFDIVNGRNRKYHHWLTPVQTENVAVRA